MRQEWLILVVVCVISSWLFLDEEPMLDLTDLGLVQSLCLGAVALAVTMENVGRANSGFFVSRDRQLGLWAVTFWSGMDNYFRIVILGFFAHSLAPMWVDMAESTSSYAFILGAYWVWGAQMAATFAGALCIMYSSSRIPLWVPLLPLALLGWFTAIGDCLISGLGSSAAPGATMRRESAYGLGASSMTYDPVVSGEGFDWHKGALEPNNFFFIDLASLLYGVLLIFALLVLAYVLIVGVLLTHLGAQEGPSYAFRAVIIRALEHSLVGALGAVTVWGIVGLRVGMDAYAACF